MALYIFKRFLLFIPTLFIISLIAFFITVHTPGDPVDRMLHNAAQVSEQSNMTSSGYGIEKHRILLREKLGLDLPLFYFSLRSAAEPDSLYKIFPVAERNTLSTLVSNLGNWRLISNYYLSISSIQKSIDIYKHTNEREHQNTPATFAEILTACSEMKTTSDMLAIESKLISLNVLSLKTPDVIRARINELDQHFIILKQSKKTISSYLPAIDFHPANQYHRWLFGGGKRKSGVLLGDFGISYVTSQPVMTYIMERLPWTLFFSIVPLLLAYLISIPLALKMVKKQGEKFDRRMSAFLSLLYSLPVFWFATLLLMLLANPSTIQLFPASGIMPVSGFENNQGAFEKFLKIIPYLILPTICYAYSFIVIFTRLLRASLRDILQQEFVKAARAKGLSEKLVLRKHALRNALLPTITIMAHVFPMAVSGSVIIENVFTIPGLGSGIYESIQSQDYPVMICIFTVTGLLTMLGYLISDIVYAIVDPRIRFQ